MATKKVRIKVKKKKLKVKRIIVCVLILVFIYFLGSFLIKQPIKNIYITGNDVVSEQEIISLAKLNNYPSFLLTTSYEIRKKLLTNDYIKDVKVTKKFGNKLYLDVTEYKVLCIEESTKKIILGNKDKKDNIYNITDLPLLINDISSVYNNFIKKMNLIDNNILQKISQIEYLPNEVDNERFLFYMNDGNYVYITLPKIKKINKYPEIVSEMAEKKGIIYLDSGDYVEIKE